MHDKDKLYNTQNPVSNISPFIFYLRRIFKNTQRSVTVLVTIAKKCISFYRKALTTLIKHGEYTDSLEKISNLIHPFAENSRHYTVSEETRSL